MVRLAATLSATIREAQAAGDPDCGDSYYSHWLTALERMVTSREVTSVERLAARREAWHRQPPRHLMASPSNSDATARRFPTPEEGGPVTPPLPNAVGTGHDGPFIATTTGLQP